MADTPLRKIRVDDELWEGFGQAVAASPDAEADRAKVLRQFMRWYRRERGARLPERPRDE
jgi:hypothetical protein